MIIEEMIRKHIIFHGWVQGVGASLKADELAKWDEEHRSLLEAFYEIMQFVSCHLREVVYNDSLI